MNDFNALLTRSFAEAEHPADDGFSVRVGAVVAKRERAARLYALVQRLGVGVGLAIAGYFCLGAALHFGQDFLAAASLDLTRAVGGVDAALDSGPMVFEQAESSGAGLLDAMGLGLTQILLIAGALAGGAVAYRSAQE
jgi:hypothetical protein